MFLRKTVGKDQFGYEFDTNLAGEILLKVYDDYAGMGMILSADLEQVAEDVLVAHVESLIQHITYVREAGEKIGVRSAQLKKHDRSKWGEDELVPYALHFQGGGAAVILRRLDYNATFRDGGIHV